METTQLHDNAHSDFLYAIGNDISQTNTMKANMRFYALTLNRSELSQLYLEHGIIQVLIDQPVDDAYRGGVEIVCPELSADDIKAMDHYIQRNSILQTYCQALKWSRLFGGAGVLINCGQDLSKPLKVASITERTPLEFYAVDRWELSYQYQGYSVLDQTQQHDIIDVPYNYYGHPVHKENVIKLNNKMPPSLIRGQFGGWGVSEIEKIVRSYNMYLKHQSVTFEILDESKLDIFKLESFNSQISTPTGAVKTARRIREAAAIKNYQNALVMDKNDEYEQKQLAFAGIAEILNQLRIGLACDLRMPMTKLFGLSASGFSAGEEDIENYNSMIESEIRSKSREGLILVLGLVAQKVLGYIPESLDFSFKSLRIMNTQQESQVKTDTMNRIVTATNNGLCTPEKAVELINIEKIFSVELEPSEALDKQDLKAMDMTDGEKEA